MLFKYKEQKYFLKILFLTFQIKIKFTILDLKLSWMITALNSINITLRVVFVDIINNNAKIPLIDDVIFMKVLEIPDKN